MRGQFDAIKTTIRNNKIREDQMITNSVPAGSERYLGTATRMYGGLQNSGGDNSLLRNADKFFKDGSGGRSLYAKNRVNNRLFNQLTILDRETLSQIQPHISGRGIFVVGEMPRMMSILYPRETEYIRSILSSCIVGISGFQDRRLETGSVTGPTEQNSMDFVVKQTGSTRQLTLSMMMLFRGLPVYKYITTWMQLIYNAGSGAASYPYYTELDYNEGNHSMTAVYVVVDPSYQVVEDAALIYAMVPLVNNASKILNQTWGEHQIQQYDLEFKCHTIPGGMPQVLKIGNAVLADYISEVELHDFNVIPASDIDNPDMSVMGIGDNVLNEEGKKMMARLSQVEKTK